MQMNAKCIRMATTSKQKITSVAESVEKLGPFCLAAVKARWISKPTEGNITEVRQNKFQVHLVQDPGMPVLGMDPEESKAGS